MIKRLDKQNLNAILEVQKGFIDGWNKEMLISSFNNPLFYAYGFFEEEQLIGFITLGKSDVLDIETVFVKQDYRHQGVGKTLIEKAVNLAKELNVDGVLLEVRRGNISAVNLYKKMGFTEIAVRKKYYSGEEDAIIFKKEL